MTLPSEIDALLRNSFAQTYPTGSRFICEPAPTTTDEDYLVVLQKADYIEPLRTALDAAGFEWDVGEGYEEGTEDQKFWSYRRDDLNLLITADHEFARRHKLATQVCKALNLLEKKDRITVFQALLYDRLADTVTVILPDLTETLF
jgi:hypothetical protein